MENYLISIIAVIISILIILSIMKFLKYVWNKILWKLILFFKPELKNIYDLLKWIGRIFKKKETKQN